MAEWGSGAVIWGAQGSAPTWVLQHPTAGKRLQPKRLLCPWKESVAGCRVSDPGLRKLREQLHHGAPSVTFPQSLGDRQPQQTALGLRSLDARTLKV